MASLTSRMLTLAKHPHLIPKYTQWWAQGAFGREPSFTADGLTFAGFPNFSAYAGAWRHMMPERERSFFRRHVRGDATVFDVGANFGTYASLFAKIEPRARVFAFEPHPVTAAVCRRNILTNRLSQVKIVEKAVGREVGMTGFTSHGIPGTERIAFGEDARLTVPVTTLDAFCEEHEIETIHFLKIDVEGAEVDVVAGASDLFSRGAVKSGIIEVSQSNLQLFGQSIGDLESTFARYGYRLAECGANGSLGKPISFEPGTLTGTINAVFEFDNF